jgi:hypothetical protein
MEKASKGVAWICIFSTFPLGCYSSAVIAPAEKERVHAGSIEYVITKDGKKCEFEKAPVVANDSIVGGWAKVTWLAQVNQEEDTILHSEVAMVGQSPSGKTKYVVTKAGAKYTYREQPAFVNGAYVGKGRFAGHVPLVKEQLSIPLSDVSEISVSELSNERTLGLVFGGVAIIGVAAIVASSWSLPALGK